MTLRAMYTDYPWADCDVERAILAEPGWHTLTLVDDQGFRLRQRIRILGR